MENQRNKQLLTPKPLASGHLEREAQRGGDEHQARRDAEATRIYKNRLKALGAIGVLMVAGGAAGSGRLLVRDVEQGAQDAFNNRVEAVDNAFSHPGRTPGEPQTGEAAHQIQLNKAHNAAAEVAQTDAQPK